MAGNDGAASLHCVAMRVIALSATGTVIPGTSPVYTTNNLTRIDFNPDIEAGPEISDRNAGGGLAVTFRLPDIVKRLVGTVEIVTPDPELEVILSGGNTLVSATNVQGMQYPALNVESSPNGVSVEAWTRSVVNGRQPTDFPYMRWVFPLGKFRKSNRVIDINRMGNVFEGFWYENPNWGSGVTAQPWAYDSSKVVQWAKDTTYPASALGATKA